MPTATNIAMIPRNHAGRTARMADPRSALMAQMLGSAPDNTPQLMAVPDLGKAETT